MRTNRRLLPVLALIALSSGCVLLHYARPVTCASAVDWIRQEYTLQEEQGVIPRYLPATTSVRSGLLRSLELAVARLNFSLVYTDLQNQVIGQTSYQLQVVVVEVALTTDARVEVLSHELGHVVHPHDHPTFQNPVYREVWAETVGAAVQFLAGRPEGVTGSVKWIRGAREREPEFHYPSFLDQHGPQICAATQKVMAVL